MLSSSTCLPWSCSASVGDYFVYEVGFSFLLVHFLILSREALGVVGSPVLVTDARLCASLYLLLDSPSGPLSLA